MMNSRIACRWVLLALLPFSGCSSFSGSSATAPSPVSAEHVVRHDPNFSIHVVRINLADPRVAVHVCRGGADPDGDGPWLTTLLPSSEIAEREHYDIAINGDFFEAQNTVDIEGKRTGYVRGKFAAPVGPAMTDGALWHQATNTRPYLEVTSRNTAEVSEGRLGDAIDSSARQIIGGSHILVKDGKALTYTDILATPRHPRTAVGIDKTGKQLTLVVVDGRQPNLSVGMSLAELSQEMLRLGCYNAINLDGGGSSTLVYRDAQTQKLKILNSPSDTKERSVADILGVVVKAPLPEEK